jgi:hypothetical protein
MENKHENGKEEDMPSEAFVSLADTIKGFCDVLDMASKDLARGRTENRRIATVLAKERAKLEALQSASGSLPD